MNKNYFFLLIFVSFGFNQINAESCPEGASTIESGNKIVFSYLNGSINCGNMPASIIVDGTSTYTYESCYATASVYILTSGPAITGQDFTVTSGFDSSCEYTDATLPVGDQAFLNANLKVFPNPLTSGNSINLVFGLPMTGKLNIYNVTGKVILSDVINSEERKDVNTSSLTNGIYMLKIETDNASTTRKVVIMK